MKWISVLFFIISLTSCGNNTSDLDSCFKKMRSKVSAGRVDKLPEFIKETPVIYEQLNKDPFKPVPVRKVSR